jgi:hypothetical protein
MLPHFLDNRLTDGGKVVILTRRPPFTPQKFLVLISVRGLVDLHAIVGLEGLDKWKKSNDLIRDRTRNIPAYNVVLQPTTLPRALYCVYYFMVRNKAI